MTVTETNWPLCQLKPTFGLTPVADSSRSRRAAACLKPSVTVLVASQARELAAISR